MIRDEHLEVAVAQGILTPEQVTRLRALAVAGAQTSEAAVADPDDEKFRLIGGFNDVFVSIGVLLLIGALFGLASVLDFRPGFAVLALISAWGLSEYFCRKLRLALPSIVLAVMFAGAGAFTAWSFGALLLTVVGINVDALPGFFMMPMGAGAAIAAMLHDRRFGVPIDNALAASGVICFLTGILTFVAPTWTQNNASLLAALFGFAVFATALKIDASDRARLTRRSDIAFWLHLLAAPMIVHSVMPLLTGQISDLNGVQAVGILAVFVVLGIVALAIDRRALLVSGLTYAGIALGYLLSHGVDESLGLSLTLLGLAAIVLGLSAGWKPLRRALLPALPLGSLRALVPPPA